MNTAVNCSAIPPTHFKAEQIPERMKSCLKSKENQISKARRAWGLTHSLGSRLLPTALAKNTALEKRLDSERISSYFFHTS